jgi:hypothetical protein
MTPTVVCPVVEALIVVSDELLAFRQAAKGREGGEC